MSPTPTAPGPTAAAVPRAWGWVAHLRDGGTTPWVAWRDSQAPGREAAAAGPWLPGAQQLELVRRLNLIGTPSADLTARTLTAAATGRGRRDVPLRGLPADDFGPASVDPADLVDDDLLRVAAGLLARDVAGSSGPREQPPRRVRRLRARYRLVGDPEIAGPVRAVLIGAGLPPGGRGAAVHVVGTDLATMLAHAWTAGAFAEGGPTWLDFLRRWAQRDGVPTRVDLATIADRWRADPSVGRVDVVLDAATLPGLLRLPRGPHLPGPPSMGAAAAEVARRTALALGGLVPDAARSGLLTRALRARLAAAGGPPPVVPVAHRAWVADRAQRLRERVVRTGHPVVGDLDTLLPRGGEASTSAGPTALDLALRLLLDSPVDGPVDSLVDAGRRP